MEFLRNVFSETLIEAFGWTLFHSVWQATIVAIILLIILSFFKKKSAQNRYILSYTALIAILVWSTATFIPSYKYALEKQKTKDLLIENPEQIKELVKNSLMQVEENNSTVNSKSVVKKAKFRGFMQRNYPVIFGLWFLGVFIFLLKMIGGLFYINRLKYKFTTRLNNDILTVIEKFSNELKLKHKVDAVQSAIANTAMVIGYLKPIILFPASLISGLSQKEIEAIIAHELAHIKRNDYLLNIIQSIIETIFFYHPAVWIISKNIRDERETSCDELALNLTNDKVNYLKAITASQQLNINSKSTLEVAFSGKRGSLLKRAIKIQNFSTMKKNVTEGFIAATIVFLSLILVSFSFDGQNLKSFNNQETGSTSINPDYRKDKIIFVRNTDIKSDSTKIKHLQKIEELEDIPEDVERLMEMAYTHNDSELSELITESITLAMAEVNISEIMQEVDSALKEANISFEINKALMEAKMELQHEHNDSLEIAIAALDFANTTIEAINIEEVVSMAMQQASVALESIDFEGIMEEAMREVSEAMDDIDMDEIMKDVKEAEHETHFEWKEDEPTSDSKKDEDKADALEEKLREIEN